MTLSDLAAGLPGDTALLAPNRQALTYGGLAAQVERTGRLLKQLGFGPHHCIAVLLPNGPELASAFLSISSGAAFAPLNPAYSVTEFKFYLEDLQAAALATIPGYCPAAEEAAKSLGIGLLRLTPDTAQPAGTFDLSGEGIGKSLAARESERRFALLLHSSGTTARPKLVGLTHENLAASAQAIAKTLRLGPGDIGLNVMPLFHIHGLAGSLLSSLLAGSSVYCPPAFNALSFAGWMAESRATWYTAVPSMHQVLLSRPDAVANLRGHVRFVRSSSAHLHTRVWQEMEARYECPV
ncbi:MAG TPA: AMP-binding protein, partial [Bryobacteraceae bacterium]|nr:AMP-binding protein [Bryobacteraceae bacterium]